MSIASIGARPHVAHTSTTKASDEATEETTAKKASLPDGILDGAVYGALTTVLLGPVFLRVPSANRTLAAIGTVAANAAIFAGLDAIMTDRNPEGLDQYLKF